MRLVICTVLLLGCSGWDEMSVDEDNRWATEWIGCSDSTVVLVSAGSVIEETGWSSVRLPPTSRGYRRGWVAPTGEIFLVATAPSGVFRSTEDGWEELELRPPGANIEAIGGTSAEHVYLSTRGSVYVLEGDVFVGYDAATWRMMKSIWSSGQGDLWLAGQGGTVRLHRDGRWTDRSPPTRVPLDGITGTSPDDVWVWGQGALFHWNGSEWSDRSAGIDGWVRQLVTGGGEDVYVSDRAGMSRWTHAGWRRMELPSDAYTASPATFCLTEDTLALSMLRVWTHPRRRVL